MATARQNPLFIGPAGVPGKQGPPGAAGTPGATGATGPQGTPGVGGSTTTTLADFTMPAFGDTVDVNFTATSGMSTGVGITIPTKGTFIVVSVVDSTHAILMGSGLNNASGTVTHGTVVSIAGQGATLAPQARLNGQVLQLVGGADTPAGMRQVLNVASANPVGDGTTDDYAAIQSVLDQVTAGQAIEVVLPKSLATPFAIPPGAAGAGTVYAISEPLVINDKFVAGGFDTHGNSCVRFRGEHQTSVGLTPTWTGSWFSPTWIGPLIIVGTISDTAVITTVNDTGMVCVVGGDSATTAPYLNLSQYDIGNINGLTAFCWEEWYNPLTETLSGIQRTLACSFGTTGLQVPWGQESHQAFQLIRTNGGSGTQISGSITTTQGGGTTTTTGSQLVPAVGVPSTLVFGSTSGMAAGKQVTVGGGIGYFIVQSVTDGTHAVVVNPGLALFGNAAVGTAITNGTSVGIEGTTTISTTLGTDIPLNTLSHIALDWDGSHLRLWINGAQPAGATPVALSGGSIIQRWYEETVTLTSQTAQWPDNEGNIFAKSGQLFHQGLTRLSQVSRYTSAFTPTPGSVTCDSGCKCLIDWTKQTPASNGFSSRISLQNDFCIVRTGVAFGGRLRTNVPVWLNLRITQVPYTNGYAEISDLSLNGIYGLGIQASASLFSKFHDLSFYGLAKGIDFTNFCYGSSYWNLNFVSMGSGAAGSLVTALGGFHSWNVLNGGGSQFMTHGDGIQTDACATQWHLVHQFSDVHIGKCFLGKQALGIFAFVGGVGNVFDSGSVIDDEDGGIRIAGVFAEDCGGYEKVGGSAYTAGPSPDFIIGNVTNFRMAAGIFSVAPGYNFSFDTRKNNGKPLLWEGESNGRVVIDPNGPGPVCLPAQEMFGVNTLTFPTDANYSVPAANTYDAFWREYLIASGTITTTRTITWPSNPGKVYQGRNNNGQSVTLATASGSATVTVTSGSTFKVQDQATGMVSL